MADARWMSLIPCRSFRKMIHASNQQLVTVDPSKCRRTTGHASQNIHE
jgi:hypothetical protein